MKSTPSDRITLSRWIQRGIRLILSGGCLLAGSAQAEDYYFDPSLLETQKSGQQQVDLSAFSKPDIQLPGDYIVDIYVNKKKITQRKLTFIAPAPEKPLIPQLNVGLLRELGIKVDEIPELAEESDDVIVASLSQAIPDSSSTLDINHGRLELSVPQIMLYRDARGYISPSRWDDGEPALFTNYTFSGSDSHYSNSDNQQRQYLNMQNGANLGAWRLRNYTAWSKDNDASRWQNINTFLQRDIKFLKSQLVIGESATDGAIFSSYQFTGARLYSDSSMLPTSQHGFAPTVRGIANTNAIVTIRQNGYTIYQSTVPAGAFEINDLNPSSFSGDLDITIEETDGTTRHFVQPFSALPMMQRPGYLKYSLTAGRYRAANNSDSTEPQFIEATSLYGVNNAFTLYGGALASEDYQSVALGVGTTLGMFGALSMDISQADSRFADDDSYQGYKWRMQYIKDLPETGTDISLGYSRYTSSGYFNFADANQYDATNNLQSSEIQFSISQSLFNGMGFYASGSQQTYWNSSQKDKNLSVGLSGSLWDITYNLSAQFTDRSDSDNDRSVFLSLSMPLDRWLSNAQATWRITQQKDRSTQHEVGINGSLLEDRRLSYNVRQRQSENNDTSSSSVAGSYRSAYGTFNAGYDYDRNSRQLSYGVSGGIVAHRGGVTLSQPLGNSFALIDANGAAGIRVKNHPGIATDPFGYAVIPYLSAYQENTIALDTTMMPDDVDVTETVRVVIPDKGAAVAVHFNAKSGRRVLLKLTDAQGKPLPFGAMASNETQPQESIVDEGGVLYIAGVNSQPQAWSVRWGNAANQQCRFTFSLPDDLTQESAILNGSAVCR
ncbi:fimbrial biogenesis outer membrane usher protein [Salmonella enterica subsp. salamae]|nr:fimbrial biogenesis outer membrane usher protein [Salmonella enterica subsp. salamae]ECJ2282162.1 fimbrial biogenesis outer membrane usher protein [Salmonella enterica subsp. salamae]